MNSPQNLPDAVDVLAVGAHPDDVEIGVGGTLARLVQQGRRVAIVDLTDGEPTPGSTGPDQRRAEAAEAARQLGVQVRVTLSQRNRVLFDSFAARLELARVIRTYRPQIVLGLAARTPMASPDHWQAMQITDAAVFYARLTKWDDEFGGIPPHHVKRQFWYPLGFSPFDWPAGGGRCVVDISSSFTLKLAALRAYLSQFPPAKERVFHLVESQNRLWGLTAGFEYGELLIAASTLGLSDLMDTVKT
ncbi:MAG: LmbE family protein [Planctomycetaceae bacterium]|nr:MAG: LmbE family protein [Planctomycetaceae bacterium]